MRLCLGYTRDPRQISVFYAKWKNRTLELICPPPYPYAKDMEVVKMTVIWGGTLAILLARLRKSLFRVDRIKYNVEDQYKRIGVYYMCIDDLPL